MIAKLDNLSVLDMEAPTLQRLISELTLGYKCFMMFVII